MKIFPGFGLVGGGSVGSSAIVSALSGQAISVSRITVSGGTITSSTPNDISQTWNSAGTTFKAQTITIADTASASGSLANEIVVNGTTVFSVSKTGGLRAGTGADLTLNNIVSVSGGFRSANGDGIALIVPDGTAPIWAYSSGSDKRVAIGLNYFLGFQGSTLTSDPDLKLYRDATDALAQRRGTSPQTHRVYASFTDSSNYERSVLQFEGSGSSRASVRRNEAAGTGTLRPYIPVTGSFTVANLPSASTIGAGGRSMVTDANATTFQSIVAGGGSNVVPVYSDGTNWRIG